MFVRIPASIAVPPYGETREGSVQMQIHGRAQSSLTQGWTGLERAAGSPGLASFPSTLPPAPRPELTFLPRPFISSEPFGSMRALAVIWSWASRPAESFDAVGERRYRSFLGPAHPRQQTLGSFTKFERESC
jgi:hypothetical protein